MCNNEQLQQQQEHSRKTFGQNRMDFFDLVPGEKKNENAFESIILPYLLLKITTLMVDDH